MELFIFNVITNTYVIDERAQSIISIVSNQPSKQGAVASLYHVRNIIFHFDADQRISIL